MQDLDYPWRGGGCHGCTSIECSDRCCHTNVFPPLASCFEHQPLTRLVIGRGIRSKRAGMVIMWSSCSDVPVSGPVTINHFVPLIPNHKPVAGEAIVVADAAPVSSSLTSPFSTNMAISETTDAAPTRVTSADDIGNDASRSPLYETMQLYWTTAVTRTIHYRLTESV